jgi:hypothetical protein
LYLFVSHGVPVCRCARCGLTRLYPQPSRSEIERFYFGAAGRDLADAGTLPVDSGTEQEAAEAYLGALERRIQPGSNLFLVAPAGHPFGALAAGRGYRLDILTIEELGGPPVGSGAYDAAVVILELEKMMDPIEGLGRIRSALKKDGTLLLVTPSKDSWAARFFGSQWPGWRPENLYYFDRQTVQAALLHTGFAQIEITRDRRRFTLEHIYQRARNSPRTGLTRIVRALHGMAPAALRRMRLEVTSSAIVVTARRTERREHPLLSIVMPVYNERATFSTTMEAVLGKELPDMGKEIIVVESNSTDGTRELVLNYKDHPGVKLILEDRPRGKGHAVRRGFREATGDIVMIQDADSEYDVYDYDALLEPLLTYEEAFVLGSRHTGTWKIRNFTHQPVVSLITNFGHFVFMTLLNVLYGQRLKDPFTMYKVFRRDCLHGLSFECNRFDFDFELVIKLLRKGYVPREIPVNYTSRSFGEGKKVSMLRDPWTWLVALFKFRFSPLCCRQDDGEK